MKAKAVRIFSNAIINTHLYQLKGLSQQSKHHLIKKNHNPELINAGKSTLNYLYTKYTHLTFISYRAT